MMRAIVLATLLAATALCVRTASAADPCPSNVVCIAQRPCDSLTTASGGREASFNGGIWVHASYDWNARTCGAITQHPLSSVPIEGTVEANEDFIVTGIPPGTPLLIHARIRVVAFAGATGEIPGYPPSNHATGWLHEASAGRVEASASVEGVGTMNTDEVRSLDFSNLAGEPFRLTMGASSSSLYGTSRGGVTLSFADLPPGAAVQSCHSDPPVPTRPTTWGKLKLRYR